MNTFPQTYALSSLPKKWVEKQYTFSKSVFHKRKVAIEFERKNYLVKTVENFFELLQVFRLRHDVFKKEYMASVKKKGFEFDKYDHGADFIVIIDKNTNKVVACYRIRCSEFVDNFYSATEFDISQLMELNGTKIELSRACVDKDYRNGIVLSLLWKGLAQYAKAIDADYLFGLSSVKTRSAKELGFIYKELMDTQSVCDQHHLIPTPSFKLSALETMNFNAAKNALDPDPETARVPSLLKSYIKAGAKVVGLPANDREFNCFDLFTILEFKKMDKSYEKKYVS